MPSVEGHFRIHTPTRVVTTIKTHLFFQHGVFFFFNTKDYPVAPIGLWTLSPRFLCGFARARDPFFQTTQRFLPILRPRSFFSYCSAVSHPKTRDFRLPEPAIVFPTGQRVTSGDVISGSGHDVIITSKRGKVAHMSPVYY